MKKHLALVSSPRPLLLLLLLLVGSTSAVPLPDTQEDVVDHNVLVLDQDDFELGFPVLREQLLVKDPTLVNRFDKGEAELDLDYLDLIEVVTSEEEEEEEEEEQDDQKEETDEEKEQEEHEGDHHRKKRQTTASGGVDVQNTRGGRRILGSVNVDHTWRRKHTLSGNFGLDHTRVSGFPSQRNYNAGLKYTFSPNKRTSFNIGAQKNWGSGGSSHSLGVGLSHTFGRKKRSPGRVKVKCGSDGNHKVKTRGNVSAAVVTAALAACN